MDEYSYTVFLDPGSLNIESELEDEPYNRIAVDFDDESDYEVCIYNVTSHFTEDSWRLVKKYGLEKIEDEDDKYIVKKIKQEIKTLKEENHIRDMEAKYGL